MEVEKLQAGYNDADTVSENGSVNNEAADAMEQFVDSTFQKFPGNGSGRPQSAHFKWNMLDGKEAHRNGSGIVPGNNFELGSGDVCTGS